MDFFNTAHLVLAEIAPSFDIKPVDFGELSSKAKVIMGGIFGLVVLAYIAILWKHGMKISNSGDNPQARQMAMQGLMGAVWGGLVIFGASFIAGLVWYMAS